MGARTLILIRTLGFHLPRSIPSVPAFEDPCVEAHLAANGGESGAPIVNLLLVWNEDDSDLFEYYDIGTEWCSPLFRQVRELAHGGTRRIWRPSDEL